MRLQIFDLFKQVIVMFAHKYTAKFRPYRGPYTLKILHHNTDNKIEITSQITHFDAPSPPSIFRG